MTILVTGGAGFIANTLMESILSRGDSVICLDNLCRGTVSNVARFTEKNSFRFSAVDLADLGAFRSCLDSHVDLGPISEVWHLAANSDIPAGIADPNVDLRDTFMTTFNLLRIMEERQIGELPWPGAAVSLSERRRIAGNPWRHSRLHPPPAFGSRPSRRARRRLAAKVFSARDRTRRGHVVHSGSR